MIDAINILGTFMWLLAGLLGTLLIIKLYLERNQWKLVIEAYFAGEIGDHRKVILSGLLGAGVILTIGFIILSKIVR